QHPPGDPGPDPRRRGRSPACRSVVAAADSRLGGPVPRAAPSARRAHQQRRGIWMQRQLSEGGLEMTFAVNHLAYFLLTNLLLAVLRASAPARVVNVSSEAHRRTILDFDDLQGEQCYGGWRQYCRSKLMNLLFNYELARRLAGTGVTVNALHPGWV